MILLQVPFPYSEWILLEPRIPSHDPVLNEINGNRDRRIESTNIHVSLFTVMISAQAAVKFNLLH